MRTLSRGPISLASARRLRSYWLDLTDGPLTILVGGSIAQWKRTLAEAEPVLASLRIEAGDQAIAADRSLT